MSQINGEVKEPGLTGNLLNIHKWLYEIFPKSYLHPYY